jgi:hypothetical protein
MPGAGDAVAERIGVRALVGAMPVKRVQIGDGSSESAFLL